MAHSENEATRNLTKSSLAQWIEHHGHQLGLSIKGRVRGGSLHLLCEPIDDAKTVPSQELVRQHFQTKADANELNRLLEPGVLCIRHLWLYGRIKNAKHPAWTVSVALMPQRYIAHPSKNPLNATFSRSQAPGQTERVLRASPQVDIHTLAEQGHPNAIAHYIHYVLTHLGLESKVWVKIQRDRPNTTKNRLWITCRGTYSPAAALVGEPIARQLRSLSLANVEDALLQFQVSGEDTPDWVLRIDLTPQEEILKEWARWGDVEAISRLVNQALQPVDVQLIEATLKDITLHLSCTATAAAESATNPVTLSAEVIRNRLGKLLRDLAPQGIHSVVIYGQQQDSSTPAWVEWLDLPGKQNLDQGVTPLELAANGDDDAIAFLLRRLLNPDLNALLATGGIRIQVLRKKSLLHIMCDAPICPAKDEVVPSMERLLRSLDIPGVKGVRLYGRRSGQRKPRWHHVIHFGHHTPMVPVPTPTFAASDAYVTELVTPSAEPMLRPDLTPAELWTRWKTWRHNALQKIRRSLLLTQLVVPTADSPELMLRSTPRHATVKTAIVWAAVGALALLQVDLGLRQLALRFPEQSSEEQLVWKTRTNDEAVVQNSAANPASNPVEEFSTSAPVSNSPAPVATGSNTDSNAGSDIAITEDSDIEAHRTSANTNVFDAGGFTAASGNSQPSTPPTSPTINNDRVSVAQPLSPITSTILANSPYPSFNSDQLDYKLALYYERLLNVGPPDVLVLGSSRALRGVDPEVLEEQLAELGYADADVFNFGINGATAQVVELVVRHILLPEQLPKMIVWADGARAFNSGRADRTYDGILASEGYERLLDGSLVRPSVTASASEAIAPSNSIDTPQTIHDVARSLRNSYQELDEQLSEILASIATSYDQRDRLKALFQDGLTMTLPQSSYGSNERSDAGLGPTSWQESDLNHDNGDDSLVDDTGNLNDLELVPSKSLSAIENIDTDGFLPLQIRFDPTQYYQEYAMVPGNYDKDYSNFQLEGVQGDALLTIVGLGQTYNIPIVFINMPLTQEYLDPFRTAHEQTFRQHMLNLALQQEHFVFRDLGQVWLDDEGHRGYFSDPSHLNRYGAYEVSKHISTDPMIPWDVTTR